MSACKFLFSHNMPSSKGKILGTFRYASIEWALRNLPDDLGSLISRMALGLEEPRVTYRHLILNPSERFGPDWHCDGQQKEDEIHRLWTWGGPPTLGKNGEVLLSGNVWEYSGTFLHKGQAVHRPTLRTIIRVSQTKMICRNLWQFGR